MNRRNAIGKMAGLLAAVIHPLPEKKKGDSWLFRTYPPQCSECIYVQEMRLGEHRYGSPVPMKVVEWHSPDCSRFGQNGKVSEVDREVLGI